MQQASQVLMERHQQENVNRFRDLTLLYSGIFKYALKPVEVNIKCSVSYLPYEARIDRVSFEYFLISAMP